MFQSTAVQNGYAVRSTHDLPPEFPPCIIIGDHCGFRVRCEHRYGLRCWHFEELSRKFQIFRKGIPVLIELFGNAFVPFTNFIYSCHISSSIQVYHIKAQKSIFFCGQTGLILIQFNRLTANAYYLLCFGTELVCFSGLRVFTSWFLISVTFGISALFTEMVVVPSTFA